LAVFLLFGTNKRMLYRNVERDLRLCSATRGHCSYLSDRAVTDTLRSPAENACLQCGVVSGDTSRDRQRDINSSKTFVAAIHYEKKYLAIKKEALIRCVLGYLRLTQTSGQSYQLKKSVSRQRLANHSGKKVVSVVKLSTMPCRRMG
jgi:hypothetical protein